MKMNKELCSTIWNEELCSIICIDNIIQKMKCIECNKHECLLHPMHKELCPICTYPIPCTYEEICVIEIIEYLQLTRKKNAFLMKIIDLEPDAIDWAKVKICLKRGKDLLSSSKKYIKSVKSDVRDKVLTKAKILLENVEQELKMLEQKIKY